MIIPHSVCECQAQIQIRITRGLHALATPSVVHGPAAWASSGQMLEMQGHRPHPRAAEMDSALGHYSRRLIEDLRRAIP